MSQISRESFHVEASRRTCRACDREFQPNDAYVSALKDVESDDAHPSGMARLDFCEEHWAQEAAGDTPWIAFWRTRVPEPEEPKSRRVVIDDDRLLEVFFRLAGTEDPLKLDLRYVIGLMLIRKRRLKLEGTRRRGGETVLRVRKSRSKELHDLLDRKLTDAALVSVSQEIGTLLDLVDQPDEADKGESDEEPTS